MEIEKIQVENFATVSVLHVKKEFRFETTGGFSVDATGISMDIDPRQQFKVHKAIDNWMTKRCKFRVSAQVVFGRDNPKTKMRRWLNRNCYGSWSFCPTFWGIWFDNERDAIMYKMHHG